jgi:hypothetical protein
MSSRHKRVVGTFANRSDVEMALRELKNANYDMNRVSVIARDADREPDIAGVDVKKSTDNKADEGAIAGAVTGGTLGGVTGLLVGLGALAIPGIGPIILAGAEATALATTLAGGAIGAAAGGLVGALIGLGIPEDKARVYDERVGQGHFLVMVSGTDEEIRQAEMMLNRRNMQNTGVYDIPPAQVEAEMSTTPTTPMTATNPVQTAASTADRRIIDDKTTSDPEVIIVDRRDERKL